MKKENKGKSLDQRVKEFDKEVIHWLLTISLSALTAIAIVMLSTK